MKSRYRDYLLRRDGQRCQKCRSEEELTVDHVVAKKVLRGLLGDDYGEFCSAAGEFNYQILCRPCNEEKSDSADDYRACPKLRQGLLDVLEEFGISVRFCVEELVA